MNIEYARVHIYIYIYHTTVGLLTINHKPRLLLNQLLSGSPSCGSTEGAHPFRTRRHFQDLVVPPWPSPGR